MVCSMTGFGRANSDEGGKRSFTVEMKSINHRYLDVSVKMPRSLLSLEEKIRKYVNERLSRGKVDIYITYNNYERSDLAANFNESLGDSYFKCLQAIRDRYQVRDDISVSLIARFQDVIYIEEKEEDLEDIWKVLKITLEEATNMLILMRSKEGEKLAEDIHKKCNTIQNNLSSIEKRSPELVSQYKQKLTDRLKELLDNSNLDETRLYMEVALFADKSSVDEEITRLKSHIGQVKETLKSDEPIGRKLDFIVQEMNREANTIASKSSDLEMTNFALNIKNEIEKIREQIQNVE
jgi:uncharacterized protein (TIGR00255 family)